MRKSLAFLALLFIALSCTKEPPAKLAEKGLTYCRFGPKITTHEEFHSLSYDPCPGTLKVQGVLWKCETAAKVEMRLSEFLGQLTREAEKICEEHCKERSPNCEGNLRVQEKCGLSLSPEDAVREGKEFGCRSVCEGQAFTYCSLYSAGFMPYDPELMKAYPPNCVCTHKKKRG